MDHAVFSSINSIFKSSSIYGLLQVGMLCVIIASFLCSAGRKYTARESNLPLPGLKTPTLSIFGSLYSFPSTSVMKTLSLPLTAFCVQVISGHSKLFEEEKCFYFDIGPRRLIILTKPEAVEELLRSSSLLQKGWVYEFIIPWLGTGLLTSSGSKWRSRRKLLTPSFHFNILKDFLCIIDEQSRIFVDVLKGKIDEEFVDIVIPVTLCTLDIICESTLGVHVGAQRNSKSEYVQAVLRATETIMDRICNPLMWLEPVFGISAAGRQFRKDISSLHNFTRKVIQQKKDAIKQQKPHEESCDVSYSQPTKKRKALMDLLIDHQMKCQDITEEDIREEIDTFAFAGHDTTSMGLSWALYLIGLYPEVQAKIHEELDNIYSDDIERCVTEDDVRDMRYLECVLKESQRLYPSVPFFGRQVEKDLDFCGYRIRKNTMLGVCTHALHRNPEAFSDPEKFYPDRFLPENCIGRHPFAYVPFSAGPRNCIGQRFAMLEEKIVIANVLRNFVVKSLDQRDKIPLVAGIILRPACPLRLTFTMRTSADSASS